MTIKTFHPKGCFFYPNMLYVSFDEYLITALRGASRIDHERDKKIITIFASDRGKGNCVKSQAVPATVIREKSFLQLTTVKTGRCKKYDKPGNLASVKI